MTVLLALAGLALLAFYLRTTTCLPAGGRRWSRRQAVPAFPRTPIACRCRGADHCSLHLRRDADAGIGRECDYGRRHERHRPPPAAGKPRVLSELASRGPDRGDHGRRHGQCLLRRRPRLIDRQMTLVGMMPKFFNLFVGPLAACFLIGMFLPRCTARSAVPAVLTGLTVSVVWSWFPEITTIWHQFLLLFATAGEPALTATIRQASHAVYWRSPSVLAAILVAIVLSYLVAPGATCRAAIHVVGDCPRRSREEQLESRQNEKQALDREGFVVVPQFLAARPNCRSLTDHSTATSWRSFPGCRMRTPSTTSTAGPRRSSRCSYAGRSILPAIIRGTTQWKGLAEALVGEEPCANPQDGSTSRRGSTSDAAAPGQLLLQPQAAQCTDDLAGARRVDDENGCLRYCPGSHRQGFRPARAIERAAVSLRGSPITAGRRRGRKRRSTSSPGRRRPPRHDDPPGRAEPFAWQGQSPCVRDGVQRSKLPAGRGLVFAISGSRPGSSTQRWGSRREKILPFGFDDAGRGGIQENFDDSANGVMAAVYGTRGPAGTMVRIAL